MIYMHFLSLKTQSNHSKVWYSKVRSDLPLFLHTTQLIHWHTADSSIYCCIYHMAGKCLNEYVLHRLCYIWMNFLFYILQLSSLDILNTFTKEYLDVRQMLCNFSWGGKRLSGVQTCHNRARNLQAPRWMDRVLSAPMNQRSHCFSQSPVWKKEFLSALYATPALSGPMNSWTRAVGLCLGCLSHPPACPHGKPCSQATKASLLNHEPWGSATAQATTLRVQNNSPLV